MGETSKYINIETGEIKKNWQVWGEDIAKGARETWENIKTGASENGKKSKMCFRFGETILKNGGTPSGRQSSQRSIGKISSTQFSTVQKEVLADLKKTLRGMEG